MVIGECRPQYFRKWINFPEHVWGLSWAKEEDWLIDRFVLKLVEFIFPWEDPTEEEEEERDNKGLFFWIDFEKNFQSKYKKVD